MNERPASEAPTTTMREFLTIFGSEIFRLVIKLSANGASYSSK